VARLAAAEPLPEPGADDPTFRRWLSAHGVSGLAASARLELARAKAEGALGVGDRTREIVASWTRARAIRSALPPLTVGDLALDGRGLISLGLRPGPDFGPILDDLLQWVLDDPSRNETGLLQERVVALTGGRSDD